MILKLTGNLDRFVCWIRSAGTNCHLVFVSVLETGIPKLRAAPMSYSTDSRGIDEMCATEWGTSGAGSDIRNCKGGAAGRSRLHFLKVFLHISVIIQAGEIFFDNIVVIESIGSPERRTMTAECRGCVTYIKEIWTASMLTLMHIAISVSFDLLYS